MGVRMSRCAGRCAGRCAAVMEACHRIVPCRVDVRDVCMLRGVHVAGALQSGRRRGVSQVQRPGLGRHVCDSERAGASHLVRMSVTSLTVGACWLHYITEVITLNDNF